MVNELDRRALASAATLSAVAGWVDAIAFIAIGGYFVSFMSGNTTRGAVDATTSGSWWIAVALLAAFVLGVATGSVAQRLLPRRPQSVALALVTGLLAVAVILAAVGGPTLAVAVSLAGAMGAVNVVFARNHAVSFGITYMTGALVKAAQGAVGAAWGERGTGWARYLLLWLAIVAGAAGGAVASTLAGLGALLLALIAVAVLLAATIARRA